jgi:methionine-rich copper-binding protein CopC
VSREGPSLSRSEAALLGLLVVILTISASSAASAHANYLRSDPAPNAHLDTPPARLLVGFSEQVKVASSGLTLLDQNGREVATGGAATADPTELALPRPFGDPPTIAGRGGVYTVAWHTVSAQDGDPASGYFAFEVGTVAAPSSPGPTSTKTQDGITVALGVSPGAAGRNGYMLSATRGNAPLPNVSRVRLRITPLDRDIGQSEIVLASTGGGSFGASGFELPFAGRYHVEAQIRRSDTVDDLAFAFDLQVNAANASPSPAVSVASVAPANPLSAGPAPTSEPVVPVGTLAIGAVLVVLTAAAAVALARRRA